MAETLTDFVESLNRPTRFKVGAIFQPEADLITVFFINKPNYAQRVDAALTIYKSFGDGELVGFELKGIRHKIEEVAASLNITSRAHGKIRLVLKTKPHLTLLLAFFMKDSLGGAREAYTSVYERAKQFKQLSLPEGLIAS